MKSGNAFSAILSTVRITVVLLLICGLVTALLGYINSVTAPIIAEQQAEARRQAAARIFSEDAVLEESGREAVSPVSGIYDVKIGSEITGYAVFVSAKGFGGAIEMLVGFAPDLSVCGVEVLSHGETPGVGSKIVTEEWFLSQFKDNYAPFDKSVEMISGATVSSNAVKAAIEAAAGALEGVIA